MLKPIDTNQPPLEPGSSAGPSANGYGPAGLRPDNDVDVSLRVDYASLIEKASQQPEADAQIVQRAREMLLSGRLESPQNIRKAAENIVKFGI
ncbi:MAG: hypothetical protein P8Z79_01070 [Sedimentisphaerales bacterium]|jgi:hypothetical protein